MTIIDIQKLSKIYKNDSVETVALENVSFKIQKGEFVAIVGPSGSGKSTLMHILGALDLPTSGKYYLDSKDVGTLNEDELADIRNQKIGFVFQSYNLLPRVTSLKNVMLPMAYADKDEEEQKEIAINLLKLVGLEDRMDYTSSQLSGGQQQRVAIARALAMDPSIILADEPTGNLATLQRDEIMEIFMRLNKKGHTIIIITHEPEIAAKTKRVISLRDGKLESDKKV
jgi:putative ABC transport system ATP-binding protein